MKIKNMAIEQFISYIEDKELYIYGLGSTYQQFSKKEVFHKIEGKIVAVVDKGRIGQHITINSSDMKVNGIDYIAKLQQGVILICSDKYMDDIYDELRKLQLPDTVICFFLPLIWTISDGKNDIEIIKKMKDVHKKSLIEKRIHCCWFSGEKKPEEYQKCIDSWKRVCPEYEIIEWNAENYDIEKNTFMKQAYEKRKWAFISDYARLDVINQYGGIYLDMDVELLENFDPFLSFKSFFNFGPIHDVDLGSGFGSVKNNEFLQYLLDFYQDKDFLDDNGIAQTEKYMQPVLLRKLFPKWGFFLDGNMQMVDKMIVLPRRYYSPIDTFFLQNLVQNSDTRGIHHYNAGWCSEEEHEQRSKRLKWVSVATGK